ncbi:hypothetical protein NliqN6_1190 [Naganishia liquefaciens]|uniref:MFS transporter n=1 Tax=Naganishia liquefaciens TaxID=104408 RepID=A0A8H3YD27_9TREE|nr:hypothetical protein NliqN6_1190 [Naganishia liquefaciens]
MTTPALYRQESEISKTDTSIFTEKGVVGHHELVDVPDTITEEDEGGNVGSAAYEKSKHMEELTPAQAKSILRKIDWFILPMFLVTQTLQYLDKTALNYAKVFGMEKAMGLKGNQFSVAASIFYVGYLVAQAPWAYLIGRYPAGRVLGVSTFIWGLAVVTMVFNRNYAGVLVSRFVLGVFEASVTPGLSLMTGFWYTRAEMPLRQTIWYSSIGWGGMIGALMAAGISKMADVSGALRDQAARDSNWSFSQQPVPRWKLIFYILGALTIAWGFVLWFFLQDGPSNAKFLREHERWAAVKRVAANGTGIKTTKFNKKQGLAALKDPKAWLLTLAMFGSSVPNGVLTNFSGPIIKGLGFSTFNAALLDCAGRSFQVIGLLIAGIVATKFQNSRILMCTVGNVLCVLGSSLLAFLPHTSRYVWPRLFGFWLVNTQSIGFTLGLVMVSSNVGSYSKRSVTSSMIFVAYCAGNAAGPAFVYESEAPNYTSAAAAMMGGYTGKLICHCLLGYYMWRSNKKRDAEYGPADPVKAADNGMAGQTEDENIHFRYCY